VFHSSQIKLTLIRPYDTVPVNLVPVVSFLQMLQLPE